MEDLVGVFESEINDIINLIDTKVRKIFENLPKDKQKTVNVDWLAKHIYDEMEGVREQAEKRGYDKGMLTEIMGWYRDTPLELPWVFDYNYNNLYTDDTLEKFKTQELFKWILATSADNHALKERMNLSHM